MMRYIIALGFCLLLLFASNLAFSSPGYAQSHNDTVRMDILNWLEDHKIKDRVRVTPVTGAVLDTVLGGYAFYSLYFPQYPVARAIPKPFEFANILALTPTGKVVHIANQDELLAFFKLKIGITNPLSSKELIAKAWLILSPELLQDGFYQFSSPVILPIHNDNLSVEGYVYLERGGNGKVQAKLVFSPKGLLLEARTTSKIHSGIRPICQATKLLDKDPLVRAMAEQSILVMGIKAKPYLDEQKKKADPALKEAIDRVWSKVLAQEGR